MPEPVDIATEVEDVFRVCAAIVSEARDASNPKLALNAAARVAQLAELLARLRGDLREGAAVQVHVGSELAALERALLAALEPYPEARAQAARALLASGGEPA